MDLNTPRAILQKYQASDFEVFCEVICNDEVMRYISGKGNTIKVAQGKFENIIQVNKESPYYGFYKVVLQNSLKVIGFAKITPFEETNIELGYALLSPYWRKGITSEMIEKMIKHCKEYLPEKRIVAIINETNKGSKKVVENNNFSCYKQEEFKGASCLFYEYLNLA